MDWLGSVQRAVNFIETNLLDGSLDNETIAMQVYSSNANFQRVFSIVTGMTVADYIRRRRLSLAGRELAETDIKVIDAAMKYGYETPDSFAKAFARFHDMPPSVAKYNADRLKQFDPILLRIEIRGGNNLSTKIIPNVPKVFFNRTGENYHFNSAVRHVMACLGEMKLADYSLIAGVSGDFFTQFYSLKEFDGDSASDYYLGLRGYPKVFEKLGYSAETIFQEGHDKFCAKITDSLDKGIPVILCNYRGPTALVIGYENERTLLYLRKDKTEPARLELTADDKDLFEAGFIIAGNKLRDVSLKQIYRDVIAGLPELLTMKTDKFVFGAEAFRRWAEDIENGVFDERKVDFFNYEVYVLCLATNSGGCQEFFEKAQELNPVFAFLEDVRKQYRITNYLWNGGGWIKDVHSEEEREEMKRLYGEDTLESLGGAFGCKKETLLDNEKRMLIVKQIRRFADCIDEVVRILNENLPVA